MNSAAQTTKQSIRDLNHEAGAAGDYAMQALCWRALGKDLSRFHDRNAARSASAMTREDALALCAEAIADAGRHG